MERLFIVVVILFFGYTGSAQFFSGSYRSESEAFEFDHVKIKHHHSPHHKYEGDLLVKACTESMVIWERHATMIAGEKAEFFKRNYGQGRDVKTVYEIKIQIDGVEEDYILLGYEDEKGHGRFIAVEEIFSDATETKLLALKTFGLVKKH